MNENDFQKQYSAAPQRIKDFLFSDELTEIIENVVMLTKLDINQTTKLTEMIGKVLLGQLSPINFYQEIESNLKVLPSQSKIINELIKNKIFEQFSKELTEYKHSVTKEPSEPLISLRAKIPPIKEKEKKAEKLSPEQTTSKQIITEEGSQKKPNFEAAVPKYSFPEPSKVEIKEPENKINKLKNISSPKISSEQQEKIRQRLLKIMQKKESQPKIVEEMEKISLEKPVSEKIKKEQESPRKKIIESMRSSEVLAGEAKKFQAEQKESEIKKEKPYIFDVKLKEEPSTNKDIGGKQKKEETSQKEPIPYKKYQKESPFGKA